MRLDDMLTFDWQVALGSEMVSVKEFQKLVGRTTGLVKIKDQYVLVDPDDLTKLYKQLENPPELTGTELLRAALSEEYKGRAIGPIDRSAGVGQAVYRKCISTPTRFAGRYPPPLSATGVRLAYQKHGPRHG